MLRAPGRNADAVAELAVALLLAATRGIVAADHDVRTGEVYKDGTIPYQRFRAWQLAGRTAGLVGLGAVGRATKWRLEGLGMQVLAADPFAKDANCTLDELLERSDVISMHVGVNPDTVGMIGAPQFDQMRDGAVYMNTARPSSTTPTLLSRRFSRASSLRRGSTTSRESSWLPTIPSCRCRTSCSPPTSEGRPTTPRSTTPGSSPRTLSGFLPGPRRSTA